MENPRRAYMETLFARSLETVHAGKAVAAVVERSETGEIAIRGRRFVPGTKFWVVAAGKAAAAMARAFEGAAGTAVRQGCVVTGDAYGRDVPAAFTGMLAGHPVPDERGVAASSELLRFVAQIPREDVLVVLLSGGASAMLSCPEPGLLLSDLVTANKALLASGADIDSINTVRKHCSSIGGGRLALASASERIEVLAVSDVPGDSLATLGSGPCVADPTTFDHALAVVERYGLQERFSPGLMAHLEAGAAGRVPESPKPGHPGLERVGAGIIASNASARSAAVSLARAEGVPALDLGEILTGEARGMGRKLAALARSIRSDSPALLIAGGETVVTVRGPGQGGRNQEIALAAALEWAREGVRGGMSILAVGSDGMDGPTDAAGAFVEAGELIRGRGAIEEATERLEQNDSYGFFDERGGLLRTGPTETNVMDLVFLRVEGRGRS
ncbi:MAG: DUF4147 domain-containing protein [Myxococcota bacterium]|nr:DUF4147 domain-containing protein [Myxococcota bacterium]